MSTFRHEKYTWSKPWGSINHSWELVGPNGAIHFNVTMSEAKYGGPTAGLEFHHLSGEGAPHHLDCPLTGGRCWHDGTSLYASEHLWPVIEPMLRQGDHETIFRVLEDEYYDHWKEPRPEPEEAA